MKKIIFIYGNLPVYRNAFFTNLSKELGKKDIEMKVFYGFVTNKETKQDNGTGYKTQKFETVRKNFKLFTLSNMLGLLEQIKMEKPDAIIFQFNQSNISQWQVLRYCKKNNVPYAIWGCNYTRPDLNCILVKVRNFLYPYIYKGAKVLIPYGTLYREFLIKIGIPQERIIVAQNTIDVESIVDKYKNIPLKREYENKLKVLYVGALAKQKRIESAIDAVATLVDENYNITFDIIGGGFEETQIKEYLLTKSVRVQTAITLHGAKYGEELEYFFLNSDIFLMPGTGGLGVNEAMAYQLPIISTCGDETIFDLIDGNGYLLKNFGDDEEQVYYLKKFMHLSQEEKDKMGINSRLIILSRASLKNMVHCHLLACLKLVSE